MMNLIRGSFIFASAISFYWVSMPAVAQSNSAPLPEGLPPAVNSLQLDDQPAQLAPQSDQELDGQLPSETPIAPSCPAGQFASAFPDVRPEHWAYEAVNRLAIGPIRCFPL